MLEQDNQRQIDDFYFSAAQTEAHILYVQPGVLVGAVILFLNC